MKLDEDDRNAPEDDSRRITRTQIGRARTLAFHPQRAKHIKFLTLKRGENERDILEQSNRRCTIRYKRENQEAKAQHGVMCRSLHS
jgi:hypothetical protein